MIVEGHSAIIGGNKIAQGQTGYPPFKYVNGGGGLVWTSDYFGRFQPLLKAEAGIEASLTRRTAAATPTSQRLPTRWAVRLSLLIRDNR